MDEDMDTIILDDTPQYQPVINLDEENSDEVVEVSQIQEYRATGRYDDVFKSNSLLAEFVDKCLELEHSEGMTRVLNRALIPAYERTTKAFRESGAFKMIFTRAICNLENYPDLKFSHVKDLCMTLKYHAKKGYKHWAIKNVGSDSVGKLKGRRKKFHTNNKPPIKRKKLGENPLQIILSDDSDNCEAPILDLDEPEPVMIINFTKDKEKNSAGQIETIALDENVHLEHITNKISDHLDSVNNAPDPYDDLIQVVDDKDNTTKNNHVTENNQNIANTNKIVVTVLDDDPIELTDDEKEDVNRNTDKQISDNDKTHDVSNVATFCISDEEEILTNTDKTYPNELDLDKLLVPLKEEEFPGNDERKTLSKISDIENEIKHYKDLVIKTEEEEVVNDNMYSPYIQCDRYKAKIVTLYQELCKLTGEKPVKRREVRLKPTNEKLQLPMLKLEKFINSNIGPDGHPHFPDFCDVVECVEEANEDGKLGFSKREVMKEARALFTYCGRALQKSRQRREWRHMLDLVKNGLVEDPAEKDPELMARLQANRTRAVTRETELLERYSQMNNTESGSEAGNYESSNNQNSKKKRIAPTTVPLPVHKVTRIVNRGNQIVEVVISEESSHNNNKTQKSKSRKSNDTDVLKISPCSIPFIRALANNGISTQDVVKNNVINYNKEINHNDSKHSEDYLPKEKLLETAHNSLLEPNNTDDYCYEVPLIDSTVETTNVVIKQEFAHIDGIIPHHEEQESELVAKDSLDRFDFGKSIACIEISIDNTDETRIETNANVKKEVVHIDNVMPHLEESELVTKDSHDTLNFDKPTINRKSDNSKTIYNIDETRIVTNTNIKKEFNVDVIRPDYEEQESEQVAKDSNDTFNFDKSTLDNSVTINNVDETCIVNIKKELARVDVIRPNYEKQESEIVVKDPLFHKSTPDNSGTLNNADEIRIETNADIEEFACIHGIRPYHEDQESELLAADIPVTFNFDQSMSHNTETIKNTDEALIETNNNTDETNNIHKSSKLSGLDFLEHFLKARVVLPRMTIKFEEDKTKQPVLTNVAECSKNEDNDTIDVIPGVKIKEEPCVDIQSELDELGDNFTMTIIDIQDPFLVMEISSDSEDEEEMDVQKSCSSSSEEDEEVDVETL